MVCGLWSFWGWVLYNGGVEFVKSGGIRRGEHRARSQESMIKMELTRLNVLNCWMWNKIKYGAEQEIVGFFFLLRRNFDCGD